MGAWSDPAFVEASIEMLVTIAVVAAIFMLRRHLRRVATRREDKSTEL